MKHKSTPLARAVFGLACTADALAAAIRDAEAAAANLRANHGAIPADAAAAAVAEIAEALPALRRAHAQLAPLRDAAERRAEARA